MTHSQSSQTCIMEGSIAMPGRGGMDITCGYCCDWGGCCSCPDRGGCCCWSAPEGMPPGCPGGQ